MLTFLTARPCESSWASTSARLMVTGHPGGALTGLGAGSTVRPREAGWVSTHRDTHSQNVLFYCQCLLVSCVPYTLTFVTLGSSPAGLTLTEACHMVATRAMDTVTPLHTALTKESLRTGFGQNTQHLHSARDISPRKSLFHRFFYSYLNGAYCANCVTIHVSKLANLLCCYKTQMLSWGQDPK